MRCSAMYASISRQAEFNALNWSTCRGLLCSGVGHVGTTPNARREGTRQWGPIVSFKTLIAMRRASSGGVLVRLLRTNE